jgi:hypothetical protein
MLVRSKLQTRQNNELAIISLEDAKAVLSNYLSEDELKSTIEESKKQIKQQFQNEELTPAKAP